MKPEYFGLECSLDLYECDPKIIRDEGYIKLFLTQICDLIDMRRYGLPIVVHFGDDPKVTGYSALQLIETSLISGHFANQTNAAYINIFSCKAFDPQLAENFCKDFFKAKRCESIVNYRK